MDTKFRITIAPKGNMSKSKTVQVHSDVTLEALFTLAKQKWKGKWNLCTLKDGTVLTNETLYSVLHDDLLLIFSHDENQMKPTKSVEEVKAAALAEPTKAEIEKKIRLIAVKSLVEEEAIQQLHNCAKLKGVVIAVGLPDLHPGKGFPIGSSVITEKLLYPHLVGEDIGCGMSLVKTGIPVTKQKPEKWHKQILGIENRAGPELEKFVALESFEWPKGTPVQGLKELEEVFLNRFGTVGRGNHFAEMQEVFHVVDPVGLKELGMDENELYLLIHSGSRNFGESIYEGYTKIHGISPVEIDSPEATTYLAQHDKALAFAKRNRAMIAYRILSQIENIDLSWLTTGNSCIIDIYHNFAEAMGEGPKIVHRKGAAPTNKGAVIIPGTRGTYTYIVKPVAENAETSGYSLAHGAGRSMNRSKALWKCKSMYPNPSSLTKTEVDSFVICENKELLYEEAPVAYKNVDAVIEDMVNLKLIHVIAVMKPVVTYKYREIQHE